MRSFVDTNVFAYRMDHADPVKQARAAEWLTRDVELVISTQVLVELHAVLTRKFRRSRDEATQALVEMTFDAVPTDRALVLNAAETADRHQLSIFDALIVEAAARGGCDELWSEDLADGSTLRGVSIVNPFADL